MNVMATAGRLVLTAALIGTIFAHAHWSVGVFAVFSAVNAELLGLISRHKEWKAK